MNAERRLQRVYAKFDRNVVKLDRCWLWIGAKDIQGYGYISYMRSNHRAHRFSYERYIGPIPEGMCLMHSCDNPSCVNPDHLSPGTWVENRNDCVSKQRHATREKMWAHRFPETVRGENNGSALVTEAQVREIRQRHEAGERVLQIAKDYPRISRSGVRAICTRQNWKHVL